MFKLFFSQIRKLGWRAWSVVATGAGPALQKAWSWYEHKETAWSMFKEAGGDFPMLVTAVQSWWFPLVLVPSGLAYGIFVEKTDHTTKHPWIPKLALVWIVFCASAVISSFFFMSFLNMPNNVNIAEFYVTSHGQRHLTNDQKIALRKSCDLYLKPKGVSVTVYSSMDNESARYAMELIAELKHCGTTVSAPPPGVQVDGEVGIVIEMNDLDHPSDQASAFMKALSESKIIYMKYELHDNDNSASISPSKFAVFVTRQIDEPK